jgi:hypothetical protein
MFYFSLITVLFFAITTFFLYHFLFLVCFNTTHLENVEKSIGKDYNTNFYSLGLFYNLKEVYGWNPLGWFLPIRKFILKIFIK